MVPRVVHHLEVLVLRELLLLEEHISILAQSQTLPTLLMDALMELEETIARMNQLKK
jgi:hypothetical protein